MYVFVIIQRARLSLASTLVFPPCFLLTTKPKPCPDDPSNTPYAKKGIVERMIYKASIARAAAPRRPAALVA